MQAADVQLTVPKRIVLYLARESPRDTADVNLTIDHLLAEAARLVYEDDSRVPQAGTPGVRALHVTVVGGSAASRTREKVRNQF